MEFYTEIASGVLKIILALISIGMSAIVLPWLRDSAIPWLKEKRLYSIVKKFVQAAEKLAETGAIDSISKKEYVVELLRSKGFAVDAELEAFIESAVKELDIAVKDSFMEIVDEFEVNDEIDSEDTYDCDYGEVEG